RQQPLAHLLLDQGATDPHRLVPDQTARPGPAPVRVARLALALVNTRGGARRRAGLTDAAPDESGKRVPRGQRAGRGEPTSFAAVLVGIPLIARPDRFVFCRPVVVVVASLAVPRIGASGVG